MSFNNSLRLAGLACASSLFGFDGQVSALSMEDVMSNSMSHSLSQVDSQISQQDLVDGMLNMAQDGVIRIPLVKKETNYLSQLYAEAETQSESQQMTSHIPDTQFPQTFDMNDPSQLQQAINLGQLANVEVKEPLANSQNLSYIGELYIGSGTPQKVRCIFDTGSANPWILSKEGTKTMKQGLEIHPFDPTLSPSFKEPSAAEKHWVKISFGSGKIRGYFVQD